jgi:hypothetical protein
MAYRWPVLGDYRGKPPADSISAFNWFNRHMDIEKKPLQSVGLVAGAIVALVYWVALVVARIF